MHLGYILVWHLLACLAVSQSTNGAYGHIVVRDDAEDGAYVGSYPVKKLKTTKLEPPRARFPTWSPECAFKHAHYFLTPKGHQVSNPGPMILDTAGDLVWAKHFDNEFGGQAYDLQVQDYQGEKYLTFWLGDDRIRGHGAGHFYMLNSSYDVVRKFGAVNGKYADLHEFVITPQGTALIVIFEVIPFDVRPVGRTFNDVWNQYIWDCLIQEVDIATEELIFEWRASEHLNITSSYKTLIDRNDGTPNHPYDPFHFNSVDRDDFGNYLVSARYTHAIYYISRQSGKVIWTLGGKNNHFMDLSDGNALNFAWQHDARFVLPELFPTLYAPPRAEKGVSTVLLSLFDNAAEDWNYEYGPDNARGLLLELKFPTPWPGSLESGLITHEDSSATVKTDGSAGARDKTKLDSINGTDPAYTVRVVQPYINSNAVRSSSQGSMQILPPKQSGADADVLIGYGINAAASTFSGNGTLLCDMHFGSVSSWERGDVQSYRVLGSDGWVGQPRNPPDVLRKGDAVYVSWNGATEVQEWAIETFYPGEADKDWEVLVKVPKSGFETAIELPEQYRKTEPLRVVALDKDGKLCEHGFTRLKPHGWRWITSDHSWYFYSFWITIVGYWTFIILKNWMEIQRRKKDAERYKLP